MVVVDFKGENAQLTAEHRAKEFGHEIVILDPFDVVTRKSTSPKKLERPSASFNPLDQIKAESPLVIDDCKSLAEMLVVRPGEEKEPHWNDSAEKFITGNTAVVTQFGEATDRSLQTVRTLLTNPHKMAAVNKVMCESSACGGMLARLGNQLTYYKDKELSSVLTTTNRHLDFLDTLAIAENTRASSFDPADLCKGKMTVYLVLPPDQMGPQAGLLRMWIGCLLRAVVRGGLQEKNKVHFILDEAASLGRMSLLDHAVNKYRGYGVRLQFYYQSMGQLKKCWPEGQDQTLLSNTTQVYFGTNDPQTAEYVSNRLGESTIVVSSGGRSKGGSEQNSNKDASTSRSTSWNDNDNWVQQARKLLKPEEVAGLSNRTAITFAPGMPPIWTTLVPYFEERRESRWQRLKWLAQVWLASVVLLALAAASAVMVTMAQVATIR